MSREYKSRVKKLNKMTKNGLIELNAVTKNETNISNRERDYDLRSDELGDNRSINFGRKRDRKSSREFRKSKQSLKRHLQQPPENRQDIQNIIEDRALSTQTEIVRDIDKPFEAAKPEQRSFEARSYEITAGSSKHKNPVISAKSQSADETPVESKTVEFVKSANDKKLRFNKNSKLNQVSLRSIRSKPQNNDIKHKKKQHKNISSEAHEPQTQQVSDDVKKTDDKVVSDIPDEKYMEISKNPDVSELPEPPKAPEKSSKLQFNKNEKIPQIVNIPADKKLDRLKNKSEQYNNKLEKARGKLPSKKHITKTRTFDESKGKSTTKFQFEKEILPQTSQKSILPAPVAVTKGGIDITRIGAGKLHQKVYEVENENVGTKSAHYIERVGESAYRGGKRVTRSAFSYVHNSPYRTVEKLEQKSAQANHLKYEMQKTVNANPQLKSNAFSRYMQKRKIKQQYVKAAREAKKTGGAVKKTGDITAKATKVVVNAVKRHPVAAVILLFILMIIFFVTSMCSAFGSMAGTGFSAFFGATYLASDEDITQADLYYTELETDYAIGNAVYFAHNPHELAAFLTAVYGEFAYADVEDILRQIFEKQTTEYKTFTEVTAELMTDGQRGIYELLLYSRGNRQFVGNPFDFDWTSGISSYFGYRVSPITGVKELHRGIDIPTPIGTEIRAGIDGIVTFAGYSSSYGNYITIERSDGISVRYAHCNELLFTAGQEVQCGDIVAKSGNTGASTGPHLHIELAKNGILLNPIYFVFNN